jgi:hypothetical protein
VPFGRTIGVGAAVVGGTVVVVGGTVVVVGGAVVVGATVVVVGASVVVTAGNVVTGVVVLAALDPPHAASAAKTRIMSFFKVRTSSPGFGTDRGGSDSWSDNFTNALSVLPGCLNESFGS